MLLIIASIIYVLFCGSGIGLIVYNIVDIKRRKKELEKIEKRY